MKRIVRIILILAIVLIPVFEAASAEEIDIQCFVLDNGYFLDSFLNNPSMKDLIVNSSVSFTMAYNPERIGTKTSSSSDSYIHIDYLLQWIIGHYMKCDQTEKSINNSMCAIIPTFMPSFIWVYRKGEEGVFVANRTLNLRDGKPDNTISIFTHSEFLNLYYSSQTQINIIIDVQSSFSIVGVKYPNVTMIPINEVIKHKGGSIIWNADMTCVDVSFGNDKEDVLSFENHRLRKINGYENFNLHSILLGLKTYAWYDKDHTIWMDVESLSYYFR